MVKKIRSLLPFVAAFAVSLLVMYPTFNLSLWGDDWMVFWSSTRFLESQDLGNWNYLSLFFTAYGPMYVLVGTLMRHLFDFNSAYYYLTSFTFRVLASFSLYPLTLYLTKDKLAAFFAMLFFSITTIGLETTDVAALVPSYIALIFLNLFLYFYLKAREYNNAFSYLFFASTFFIFAIVTAPIRMTGLLPLILTIEIFWLIRHRNFDFVKRTLQRLFVIISLFLVLYNTNLFVSVAMEVGAKDSQKGWTIEHTINAIKVMNDRFKQGDFGFLLNPIVIIGGMLLPYYYNTTNSYSALLLFTGTLIFIASAVLIMRYRRHKFLPDYIFLSLALIVLGFILPWIWDFTVIYPPYHRYLITPAIGISILLAMIIGLIKTIGLRVFVFVLLSIILLLHIISTQRYIEGRLLSHSQLISNRLWSQIPYIPEIGKTDKPIVFYLYNYNGDDVMFYEAIGFGLDYRIGLLYHLDTHKKMPAVMRTWDQVLSAVGDGKSLQAQSYPGEPIPIDNVYAFMLVDKDSLLNITYNVREELKKQTSY